MSQLAVGPRNKTIERQNWTETTPQALYDKCLALANNLWWSWHPEVVNLFRDLDPIKWRKVDHNPIVLLAEMTPEVKDLAELLIRATTAVGTAVAGLRDLKRSQTVLDACIEVNRLENEGDEILRNAVAKLFRTASDPLYVMKWKEVYETLESATDRCEDVANIIEGVVLEHA